MIFLGLHIVDWIIITIYFIGLFLIGNWTRKKVKNTKDFYQANRSFGKVITTFLSFGNMVSSDQAAGVTREIYRQGLSGIWFQNLVLFITPFHWFISILQRRARYLAPGDIYEHRFESKFLAGLFAFYLLLSAIYGSSIGYLITGKTMQAIMVKPETEWTQPERTSVLEFREYQDLLKKQEVSQIDDTQKERLSLLTDKKNRGELNSYITYLNLTVFYIIYGLIAAAYVIMGGLFAAAFTDILQGILILFLSIVLIPMGLIKLGGFAGLHAAVPDYMFQLFGTAATSEYTWYFVLAMVVTNLIGLAPRSFTIGGSAKDDNSARIGAVVGAFAKRFIMIGWALTGLIAVGLYAGKLSDATYIWGHMTKDLLGVGFIGLMIASVIAANMAQKASQSLEWSAGFTKNILLPIFPHTKDKVQVLIGRIVIFVVLMGGIVFAYSVDDILIVFKYILSIGTIIGPSLWLVYFWRRLNTKAVVIQMLLSIFVTVILPVTIPSIPGFRDDPKFTKQTLERVEIIKTKAVLTDIELGKASSVGQIIEKREVIPPTGIFYEKIIRKDRNNPDSPLYGEGMFRVQLYFYHLMGVNLESMSKAMLSTISFIFDIIFPFLILFFVSLTTKPNSEKALNKFYANILTPSISDQEQDEKNTRELSDNPEKMRSKKLFPNSNWMFWKPTKMDIWGFVICCVLVAVIIALYLIIMQIGA
jgi:solute:Na+ symporter, SSS family